MEYRLVWVRTSQRLSLQMLAVREGVTEDGRWSQRKLIVIGGVIGGEVGLREVKPLTGTRRAE